MIDAPPPLLIHRAAHFKETGGATYVQGEEQVYFSYSNNSNPQAMLPLRGGRPILSSVGFSRSGARDPFLFAKQDGSFIVMATDNNISAAGFSFDLMSRNGSRSVLFWDSKGSDISSWSDVRSVEIAVATQGMAWAPEVILDPTAKSGKYVLTYATRNFAASDPTHTGTPSSTEIWYTRTDDFRNFTAPQPYLSLGTSGVIQLTLKRLNGTTFVRFLKEERPQRVRGQISTTGIFGTWTDIGSATDYVDTENQSEGPLLFRDNLDPSLYHIWVDLYGSAACQGYVPYESRNITAGVYTKSDKTGFPACGQLKQGSVIPITAAQRLQLLTAFPA